MPPRARPFAAYRIEIGVHFDTATRSFAAGSLGSKGRELLQSGQFPRVLYPIPDAPQGFGE
jgi:hypothetical protein